MEPSNQTVEMLGIAYIPDHWPPIGTYQYFAGHVDNPWDGGTAWKSYDGQLQRYNDLKVMLAPNDDGPVNCLCTATIVPPAYGSSFAVLVNGLHLSSIELDRSKQKELYKVIRTPIATCNAKIDGGGCLPDGRQQSYRIWLDIPNLLSEPELLKRQRSKERLDLWGRFRLKVLKDFYRGKLLELFDRKCYNCGADQDLQLDHHIPLVSGGHSVPGNLVALCKRCNSKKRSLQPVGFYTQAQLDNLTPLFERQEEIFLFEFDWDFWQRDHEGYLISLGLEPSLVHDLFADPDHRYHMEPPSNRLGVTISIDLSGLR